MPSREIVKCSKCGENVSRYYSFCPHCQKTLGPSEESVQEIQPETAKPNTKASARTSALGKINRREKYYVCVFIMSGVLGFAYGLLDPTLARMVLPFFQIGSGESALSIFSHNLLVAILSTLTGGVLILVSQFVTFAVAGGGLRLGLGVSHAARPISVGIALDLLLSVILVLPLEQCGFLCFSLIGFTGLERIFWKQRTDLRWHRLLLLGICLLLVAATIESLAIALRHTM